MFLISWKRLDSEEIIHIIKGYQFPTESFTGRKSSIPLRNGMNFLRKLDNEEIHVSLEERHWFPRGGSTVGRSSISLRNITDFLEKAQWEKTISSKKLIKFTKLFNGTRIIINFILFITSGFSSKKKFFIVSSLSKIMTWLFL